MLNALPKVYDGSPGDSSCNSEIEYYELTQSTLCKNKDIAVS